MSPIEITPCLSTEVLDPMKRDFVGKDEVIDLLGICLIGGENLFILGPPGTAKSALVHQRAARHAGKTFDDLLTRFTEPNERFGPFDIRKLRDRRDVAEASLVFLDELLNANSAILNSLLVALNERLFRRGKETRPLAALMAGGFLGLGARRFFGAWGLVFGRFCRVLLKKILNCAARPLTIAAVARLAQR